MACRNALLVRYKVRVEEEAPTPAGCIPADPSVWWKDITKVTGLGLGEEGEVDVPEWDRKVKVSDGKRDIKAMSMQMKIMSDLTAFNFFLSWYQFRADACRGVYIDICDRAWNTIFTFKYTGVEMRGFNMEDQELGQTKLGYVDMMFSPYDVLMLDPLGNVIFQPPAIP